MPSSSAFVPSRNRIPPRSGRTPDNRYHPAASSATRIGGSNQTTIHETWLLHHEPRLVRCPVIPRILGAHALLAERKLVFRRFSNPELLVIALLWDGIAPRRYVPFPRWRLLICCLLQSSRSRDIGWSQADYGAAALLRGLYARMRPWYRSTCDCSRSPRFGVPQGISGQWRCRRCYYHGVMGQP